MNTLENIYSEGHESEDKLDDDQFDDDEEIPFRRRREKLPKWQVNARREHE